MTTILILLLALTSGDAAPAPASREKPKLVCRQSEVELGSHIRSGRRCKTAEEWQQEDSRKSRIPPDLTIVPNRGDGAVPTPNTRPQ